MNRIIRMVAAAVPAALMAGQAPALINPNYTPVQLVEQAGSIVRMDLSLSEAQTLLTPSTLSALKGHAPTNLSIRVPADLAATLPQTAARTMPAILITGDFSAAAIGGVDAEKGKPEAMLHVEGQWFGLFRGPSGAFILGEDPIDLKPVWEGSSEMLGRLAEAILADPRRQSVPVQTGVRWQTEILLATNLTGTTEIMAVDLPGSGPHLFVASPHGDRLYRIRPEGAGDGKPSSPAMTTASTKAAWVDMNNDGALDLASWNGAELTLWPMKDTARAGAPIVLASGIQCLSLTPISVGSAHGLLAGTTKGPCLIVLRADGTAHLSPLPGAEPPAGPCTAADFDNDGNPDALCVAPDRVFLYKGTADGTFKAPIESTGMRPGETPSAILVSDYDADGLLDVITAGASVPAALLNRGDRFENARTASGELKRFGQPGVCAGALTDINNDGRPECIFFRADMPPQPFFNRGFFCFGYAKELEFQDSALPSAQGIAAGQQAGTVADLDGDGIEEIALVTRAGQLLVIRRDIPRGTGLSVTAALPRGARTPATLTATDGRRSLGARLTSAAQPAFFGKAEKGPMDLTWQTPGGKGSMRVMVLRPTRTDAQETTPTPDAAATGL